MPAMHRKTTDFRDEDVLHGQDDGRRRLMAVRLEGVAATQRRSEAIQSHERCG